MVTGPKPKQQRKKSEGVMATPGVEKVLDRSSARGGGRHPSAEMTGSRKVKAATGGSEGEIASSTEDVSGESRRTLGTREAERAQPYQGFASSDKGGMSASSQKGRRAGAPDIETAANTRQSGRKSLVAGKAGSESKSTPPGRAEVHIEHSAPAKGTSKGKRS